MAEIGIDKPTLAGYDRVPSRHLPSYVRLCRQDRE